MIKVNLLGEVVDKTAIYFLQILGYACALVAAFGVCYFLHSGISTELELAQKKEKQFQARLDKLKEITKDVEGLEEKKRLLKEKLMVIANLKSNKQGPVRYLDELNIRMPERAWLNGISEKEGVLQADGIAVDNTTISDFMLQLEESEYFKDVDLIHSTQIIQDEVKLQEFSVTAALVGGLEIRKNKMEKPAPAKNEEA